MIIVNYSSIIRYYFIICLIVNISQQVPLKGTNVRDAETNEFPAVVALGSKNLNNVFKQFCTGTLISRKHVLTAAHCLANIYPISIEISIGSRDLRNGNKYYPSFWITYTQWKYQFSKYTSDSLAHDIAIIALNSSVSDVEPATLSKLTSNELNGTVLKIAGWGMTNNDVKPNILKTALLKVISNNECNDQISVSTNGVDSVHDNNFCSKADPWILSDCGDSGGPSFDKDNGLIGVTIGRCPRQNNFVVPPEVLEEHQLVLHSSVDYYRDFIEAVTKN